MEVKQVRAYGRWLYLSWRSEEKPSKVYISKCLSGLSLTYDKCILADEVLKEGSYKCHVGLNKEAGFKRRFLDFKILRQVEKCKLVDFVLYKRKSWDRVVGDISRHYNMSELDKRESADVGLATPASPLTPLSPLT